MGHSVKVSVTLLLRVFNVREFCPLEFVLLLFVVYFFGRHLYVCVNFKRKTYCFYD